MFLFFYVQCEQSVMVVSGGSDQMSKTQNLNSVWSLLCICLLCFKAYHPKSVIIITILIKLILNYSYTQVPTHLNRFFPKGNKFNLPQKPFNSKFFDGNKQLLEMTVVDFQMHTTNLFHRLLLGLDADFPFQPHSWHASTIFPSQGHVFLNRPIH